MAIESFQTIANSMSVLISGLKAIDSDVAEMDKFKENAIISIGRISAVSQEAVAISEQVAGAANLQFDSLRLLKDQVKEMDKTSINMIQAVGAFKIQKRLANQRIS